MTTNKTVDDKSTDKPDTTKASTAKSDTAAKSKSTANKASETTVKKESATVAAKKDSAAVADKSAAKKDSTAQKTSVANEDVISKTTAATQKAAASKESDMKAAVKKISELDKIAADNAIKSKKGAEDLKARAHEARLRAQEKILEKSYVSDPPEDPLERLANTFDNSARRWEMVVYPSLFAFVLLAGYGFFLIYRLTHDIAVLSQSVTHMAVIVSDAMPRMTKDLNLMTGSIDNMTGNIDGMSTEISSMSGQMNSLTPMSKNISSMTHNIGSMNRSVYGMQRDIGGMNRTVSSGPLGMMNDVMPFSSSSNVPQPLAPSPVWPAYNPAPYNYGAPNMQNQRQNQRPAARSTPKPAAKPQPVAKPKAVEEAEVALKKKPLSSLPPLNSKQLSTPLKKFSSEDLK